MSTTTTPNYTGNTANNIRASSALAASGTANYDVDYSAKFEGQIHVNNTPGAAVSGTRGLRVDVYRNYGATPTLSATPFMSFTMPSTTASTLESLDFFLSTGKYNIKITNLDAAQGLTVGITGDTVNSVVTV